MNRRLLGPALSLLVLTLFACSSAGADGGASDSPPPTGADARVGDAPAPPEDTGGVASAQDAGGEPGDVGSERDAEGPPESPRLAPPPVAATDEPRRPRDLHLTWQGPPATTVTIQWQTEDIALDTYHPRVWFARADEVQGEGVAATLPFDEAHVFEGAGVSYPDYMGNGAIWVQWTVELTGLVPDTPYVYVAGTWDSFDPETAFVAPNLTNLRNFRTGVAKGDRRPFRFVSAGDSRGGYDGITANIQGMRARDAAFWLFNGDMNETDERKQWSSWFEAMAPVLDDTVLMPVQGNHEFLAWTYYELFALPREPDLPEDLQEFAWSVDYANAHLVGLNSSLDIAEQVPWLEADLTAAAADPDIDWLIVVFHHAAYSASKHGSTPAVQNQWVPLFERLGVDIVFNGHDHNYERTHVIRDGAVAADGDGVVYVVAGAFFATPYDSGNEWWTATSTDGDVANYTVVDVDGGTLHVTAYSGDGSQVLDDFTLQK